MQCLRIQNNSKISCNFILFIMYILIVLDYILTYIGINILDIVSEANPLMIKFMELPFYKGLFLRCLFGFLPVLLLKSIEKRYVDLRTYKLTIASILGIQIIPYTAHIIWLYSYFSSINIQKITLHMNLFF